MSNSSERFDWPKDSSLDESYSVPIKNEESILYDLVGKIDDELQFIRDFHIENLKDADEWSKDQILCVKDSYVRFELNNMVYALSLMNIHEIIYFSELVKLPNLPSWIAGIISLKGEILTLVNLKKILNTSSYEIRKSKHVIISHYNNIKTGLIVDKVIGTCILSGAHRNETLNFIKNSESHYISECLQSGDTVIRVIHTEKLFSTLGTV